MTQPPNPWGYDLWLGPNADGVLDIDAGSRLAGGLQVLIQSVIMAQTTPTGSLIGAPNLCFDIRSFLSAGMTQAEVQQLSSYVQMQLLRDQRILQAKVSASYNQGTGALTVTEVIQSSLGPFTLTLSVSNVANEVGVNVLYSGS